jgi:hypothetical protein
VAELYADVLAGHRPASARCAACGRPRKTRTRPGGNTVLQGAAGKCWPCYTAGRRGVPGRGPRPDLKLSDSGYGAFGVASQEAANA